MKTCEARAKTSSHANSQNELELVYSRLSQPFSKFGAVEISAIKIGVALWILVAIVCVFCMRSPQQANIAQQSNSYGSTNAIANQSGSMLTTRRKQPAWHPRVDPNVQYGALQDTNSYRANSTADLQQILEDKPTGFNTPYRTE